MDTLDDWAKIPTKYVKVASPDKRNSCILKKSDSDNISQGMNPEYNQERVLWDSLSAYNPGLLYNLSWFHTRGNDQPTFL